MACAQQPPPPVASGWRARARVLRNRLAMLCRAAALALGGISLLMLTLAFTPLPFKLHRWLGTAGGLAGSGTEVILVLSGSGMPSGDELMRCHEAAFRAREHPSADVLLALPNDTALARAMVDELALRGVQRARITLLMHGRNTREQALDMATALPGWKGRHIALVTAPEHMLRSLLTFRKVGFPRVAGAPAFDHALFSNLAYRHGRIGGKAWVPDVSGHTSLRYNFWNNLKLEITCLRECTALAYYKMNGWT